MTDSKEHSERSYEIVWLGFNEHPNHNRIWGYLKTKDGRFFTFWGVRGKAIDFKLHPRHNEYYVKNLKQMRIHKGYKEIDPNHYELIAPGFKNDLEIWCATAILSESLK